MISLNMFYSHRVTAMDFVSASLQKKITDRWQTDATNKY